MEKDQQELDAGIGQQFAALQHLLPNSHHPAQTLDDNKGLETVTDAASQELSLTLCESRVYCRHMETRVQPRYQNVHLQ